MTSHRLTLELISYSLTENKLQRIFNIFVGLSLDGVLAYCGFSRSIVWVFFSLIQLGEKYCEKLTCNVSNTKDRVVKHCLEGLIYLLNQN